MKLAWFGCGRCARGGDRDRPRLRDSSNRAVPSAATSRQVENQTDDHRWECDASAYLDGSWRSCHGSLLHPRRRAAVDTSKRGRPHPVGPARKEKGYEVLRSEPNRCAWHLPKGGGGDHGRHLTAEAAQKEMAPLPHRLLSQAGSMDRGVSGWPGPVLAVGVRVWAQCGRSDSRSRRVSTVSIVVRFTPAGLTAEQYDKTVRLLEEREGLADPTGSTTTSASAPTATSWSARSGTPRSSSRRSARRLTPILAEAGIQASGPPQPFEVHNIMKR